MSPTTRALVLIVAAVGFLFDTYELLMFPVIGADAISELLKVPADAEIVTTWSSRMLVIAAVSGGFFGLLGGWLTDRLGRRTVMVASILAYSLSPVAAALSTELWQFVLFRSTTFIGVCVELVAAVTWLAELFETKRARELAIGSTLALASLGGLLVTVVYTAISRHSQELPPLPLGGDSDPHAAWRYTLLTGLIPGAIILFLLPFVPESQVWRERKRAGTLKRPNLGALFAGGLTKTTLATTLLSACGYAAAFGALQLGPLVIIAGVPAVQPLAKEANVAKAKLDKAREQLKEAEADPSGAGQVPPAVAAVATLKADYDAKNAAVKPWRGDIQLWQELGGLTGRILLAVLLLFVPSRQLIRLFLVPGVVLFPLTYLRLVHGDYNTFATAVFFCGLVTVAQFSFLSEFLPRVFPVHLRGTGGSFATNVGGRMLGTMAAVLNTEVISRAFTSAGPRPLQVATAAAVIGGVAYAVALVASFLLPTPVTEAGKDVERAAA